jgi:trehalose 6-phosphate synthase
LEPLVHACSATWVSCGTQAGDTAATTVGGLDVRTATARYRVRHVCLSEEEYGGYYSGFSNEGLWPLCHAVHIRPVFRPDDFLAYRSANRRFASAVADEATCPDPLVLVQDYHFALAPRQLRYHLPAATIVSFWHIPWPSLHVLGLCPRARDLVDGLLASDIAGFQTPGDCTNFLIAAEQILGAAVEHSSGTVRYRGR